MKQPETKPPTPGCICREDFNEPILRPFVTVVLGGRKMRSVEMELTPDPLLAKGYHTRWLVKGPEGKLILSAANLDDAIQAFNGLVEQEMREWEERKPKK